MVEGQQALDYMYVKQLPRWALTFHQAMSGMMLIRMYIALRLQVYEGIAHLLPLDLV